MNTLQIGKPRVGDFEYAKYIADNKISIKRFVAEADGMYKVLEIHVVNLYSNVIFCYIDFTHRPDILDGYVVSSGKRISKCSLTLYCYSTKVMNIGSGQLLLWN
jgi:hypothetical protein